MRICIFRSFQFPYWRSSCAHLLIFTQTNFICNLQLQPPSSSILKDRSSVIRLSHRPSRMVEMSGKKPIVPAGQRGRPSAGGPSPHGRTPQQPTKQHQGHHQQQQHQRQASLSDRTRSPAPNSSPSSSASKTCRRTPSQAPSTRSSASSKEDPSDKVVVHYEGEGKFWAFQEHDFVNDLIEKMVKAKGDALIQKPGKGKGK